VTNPGGSVTNPGGGSVTNSVPDAGSLERAVRCGSQEVERELSRVLPKADFLKMEVLGQFNLGFMIARSNRAAQAPGPTDGSSASAAATACGDATHYLLTDDLFIIDQHAADEKFRFETLQAGTEIHSQRLIAPLPLHLSAADELIVIDHMHVFNANGFQIAVDASAPPMQRLRLESLPFSKHTVFGPSDVHELVTLLAEAPAAHIRLPKLRSMFAMRACRSAVMIGMPLDHAKMRSLVRQLASLDQPWNCPHGRPTLRHLVDLAQLASTAAAVEFEGTR